MAHVLYNVILFFGNGASPLQKTPAKLHSVSANNIIIVDLREVTENSTLKILENLKIVENFLYGRICSRDYVHTKESIFLPKCEERTSRCDTSESHFSDGLLM